MSRRRPSRQPQLPKKPADAETAPRANRSAAIEPVSEQVSGHLSATPSSQGPLPSPAVLARYNDAFPGCAERIVAMTERQLTHRHTLESRVVEGRLAAERSGQRFAFGLVLLAVAVGSGLIAFDKDTAGLTVIVGALACVVAVFVYGRRKEAEERRQKRADFTSPQPYGPAHGRTSTPGPTDPAGQGRDVGDARIGRR